MIFSVLKYKKLYLSLYILHSIKNMYGLMDYNTFLGSQYLHFKTEITELFNRPNINNHSVIEATPCYTTGVEELEQTTDFVCHAPGL